MREERDCEKRKLKTSEDTQIRQTNEESNSVRPRLFVTVLIFDDTLAALSLGKFCEGHGYSY